MHAIAGTRHIGSLSTGLSALSQPFKLRLSRGTGDDALLRDYSAQACPKALWMPSLADKIKLKS